MRLKKVNLPFNLAHSWFAAWIILMGFSMVAGNDAYNGRVVYHSDCAISQNPVQYIGHSGKVSVRKWWYVDTVNGEKVVAKKSQHKTCQSVKKLISTEAEVAEAERLESISNWWTVAIFVWLAFGILASWLSEKYEKWLDEQDQIEAERQREVNQQRLEYERAVEKKIKESERTRSKKANEERAERKARRGAILEARRLANLERRKGNSKC